MNDREHNRKHMPNTAKLVHQALSDWPGARFEYGEENGWKVGTEREAKGVVQGKDCQFANAGPAVDHGRRAVFTGSVRGAQEGRG